LCSNFILNYKLSIIKTSFSSSIFVWFSLWSIVSNSIYFIKMIKMTEGTTIKAISDSIVNKLYIVEWRLVWTENLHFENKEGLFKELSPKYLRLDWKFYVFGLFFRSVRRKQSPALLYRDDTGGGRTPTLTGDWREKITKRSSFYILGHSTAQW